MRCDVASRRVVAALLVVLMALTRSQTAYLTHNFHDDAVGTSLPSGWNERTGSWEIFALSGDTNRMGCADTTTRYAEYTTNQAGKRFVQVVLRHTGVDAFPSIWTRFDWNAGSPNGYGMQIGPTGGGVATIKLTNGVQSALFLSGQNSIPGEDYVVQFYVADGVQIGWWNGVTLPSVDTAFDGQNTRTIAVRHGWSLLSGISTSLFGAVLLDMPDRLLTVTGLPVGYSALVANSVGVTMGTIAAPATTVDLSLASGIATEEIELGGWTLQILDGSGVTVEQFPSAVYPGDILAYADTPPFNPSGETVGQIITRSRLIYEDPNQSPTAREYKSAPLAVSEHDFGLTDGRILGFGDVQYSASDRGGNWQSTHARVEAADQVSDRDSAPQLRTFLERTSGRLPRNCEYILEMNDHAGILAGTDWSIIFRGKVERWAGPAGMRQRFEACIGCRQPCESKCSPRRWASSSRPLLRSCAID